LDKVLKADIPKRKILSPLMGNIMKKVNQSASSLS